MPPAASTSNLPRFLAPFGLPHASHSFNVQSVTLSCSFWTSACFPAASTSNPPRFLTPSGLLPCLPQLQRPIRHAFLLLLDFHMPPAASTSNLPRFLAPFGLPHASHSFNVQSVTLSCSFWTSACFPAASTSNPPRFLAPFGPLPTSPQLQRPIRHAFLLLLDFSLLPRSFNVQSTTLSCSFWTSTCLPQFQRPIRHAFLLLLDLCLLPRSFNVQSTTLSCSFWTSAMPPAASTSNPSRIQATLASPQPQAPHNAKKQHQHISARIALYLLILF